MLRVGGKSRVFRYGHLNRRAQCDAVMKRAPTLGRAARISSVLVSAQQ